MHIVLKRPRSLVAMQAFAIVKRLVEMNGLHRLADVVYPDVVQSIELRGNRAVHRIVGVAGVTGLVGGHAMILKMRGGQVCGIVDVKATAPRLHNVAGKAETGLFGPLEMFGGSPSRAKTGQYKKCDEREHLAFARYCDGRPRNNYGENKYSNRNKRVQKKRGLRKHRHELQTPARGFAATARF